jgi:sugar/nucleoside kinase (ribokinase family)
MKRRDTLRELASVMATSPGAEVVVAGHICLDLIPQFEAGATDLGTLLIPGKLTKVGPLVTATGGPVSNTGLALHRLGVRTRLMGKVGDDVVGRATLDLLQSQGKGLAAEMIVAQGQSSSYSVVISPPGVDRVFLHCPGPNDTFSADDVDYEGLADTRLFHFGYPPLMRRMFADGGGELSSLLGRVKDLGITTALDMARPDPASEAGRADWRRILTQALPHVDLFLPSFEETLYMLDRKQFDKLERESDSGDLNLLADDVLLRRLSEELLQMGTAVIVLKLGTQGLYVRTTSLESRLAEMGRCSPGDPQAWLDRELLAPCFQVDAVGTTGSGDCTIAGFLTAVLKGMSAEEAMVLAAAVGACNVEQADATSGVPEWASVRQRVASGWPRRRVQIRLMGWRWDDAGGVWRGPKDRVER